MTNKRIKLSQLSQVLRESSHQQTETSKIYQRGEDHPPIGFLNGVSAMIKISISNFQTKNLCQMRNFKKNWVDTPTIGGIMTSSIDRVFKKSKNFGFAHRIFCVFCYFGPISRPISKKKLMAYLLKIRQIPTHWSNFQVDILKNDEVIDF